MSEDTTTTTEQEPVQAPTEAQPETPETQAVQEQVAPDTNPTSDGETPEQSVTESNDEILDWATKKGIKTDDPIAILKMVRESESKMHEATNEAKQLREAVQTAGENDNNDESVNLLNRLRVTDFYLNNPQARQLDAEMAQVVAEKPWMAEDLQSVFEIASFRAAQQANVAQTEASRKQNLAQAAKAETAAPPQASATTREAPAQVTDEDIAKMTPAEYAEWKKETGFNPFVAP